MENGHERSGLVKVDGSDKMKLRNLLLAVLCTCSALVAGTVTVEWDNPTNNVDGAVLTDLAGTRVFYAPAVVTYVETNNVLYWKTVALTGPTNVLWVSAPSNRVTITAATAPYAIWATAVATYGAESDSSEVLYFRVGKPTTVKIKRVTQ